MTFLIGYGLGSIEATNAIFLKQRLTAAAYEGDARRQPSAERQ